VLVFERFVAFFKIGQVNIADTQSVSAGFIHVGWADSFECGADFSFAFMGFAGGVEPAVGGQDEVGLAGEQESFLETDFAFFEGLEFAAQDDRVEHDAIADEIDEVWAEDSGGNRVQDVFVTTKFEGVAGIWAALETGDDVVLSGEVVYNFTFPLIAPLEAENYVDHAIGC